MNLGELIMGEQFLWTLAVASVCSVSCALLGCYLVLKRMSLLGDAINHGVLPGIVLAVWMSGQVTSFYLFVGALLFGLLTAFLAQTLQSAAAVSEDASLGVVYTSLFALGVFVISAFLSQTDLDVDCIFMGNLESVPFKVEQVLPVQLVGLVVTFGFVVLFWKEMKIAVFDAELSTAMGYNATLLHYLLIGLVAAVAVTSFEAVGSILVLAMLIVPAATANLLTDRLSHLFILAAVVALASSLFGCLLGTWWNVNLAGMLAVVAGGFFAVAVFFAPQHGMLAKVLRQWHLTLRIAGEDILSALYRAQESGVPPTSLTQPEHGFSPWTVRVALWSLLHHDLIRRGDDSVWQLTPKGEQRAREVVRAHRLWEAFLEKNFELPLDHLHGPASWMEHFLGPHVQEELADQLHQPQQDPHGKTIPPV